MKVTKTPGEPRSQPASQPGCQHSLGFLLQVARFSVRGRTGKGDFLARRQPVITLLYVKLRKRYFKHPWKLNALVKSAISNKTSHLVLTGRGVGLEALDLEDLREAGTMIISS